jgi:hypothetical protein
VGGREARKLNTTRRCERRDLFTPRFAKDSSTPTGEGGERVTKEGKQAPLYTCRQFLPSLLGVDCFHQSLSHTRAHTRRRASAPARGRELRLSHASVPSGRWQGRGNYRSPTPRCILGAKIREWCVFYLSLAHAHEGSGRDVPAARAGRAACTASGCALPITS